MTDKLRLDYVIDQNDRFLDMVQHAIDVVKDKQDGLLLVKEYNLDNDNKYITKALMTQAYCAQAELCGKLSNLLTGPDVCDWPAPALYDSLYADGDTDNSIRVSIADSYALIFMPHPLLRYHVKKTDAPHLAALEQTLRAVPSPDMPDKHIFMFYHIFPSTGWKQRALPDNDNYLVKPIIDTVCRVWDMVDTGDELALYYDSVRDDTVPSGTYLLIGNHPSDIMSHDWPLIRDLIHTTM